MRKILSLLLVVMCFSGVAAQNTGRTITGKTKVAVYVTGKVEDGYRKVIGSKLVTGITNSSKYVAIERTREFLAAIDKEYGHALENVTDSQIAELGKQFGVKFVLVADVSYIFEEIFVSSRMINVETALIAVSAEVSKPVSNMQDLSALSADLVKKLLGNQSPIGGSTDGNGHQAVDLGLSVKWATTNVGADTPGGYGDYYSWGEIRTKDNYVESTCATYNRALGDIAAAKNYDVARMKWGGTWRLPTKQEIEELVNLCTWKWTSSDGHMGYRVTGPNGNSIFLPAAGYRRGTSLSDAGSYGDYWSSTPGESSTQYAYGLYFSSSKFFRGWGNRYDGQSVRPVTE